MDEELKAHLQGMEQRLAGRFEQGQTDLRTAVMDRFERIENRLTTLLEDVGVNMGAVLHNNRSRTDERRQNDDLFQLVLRMEQQILRLQTDVEELKKAS